MQQSLTDFEGQSNAPTSKEYPRKEYHRTYRESHKKEISEWGKVYHHKSKIKNRRKKYQQKNKAVISKQAKEYRRKNKEKIRTYQEEYRRKNKKNINEYRRNNKEKVACYARTHSKKLRLKVIAAFGGKCVRCGFDDWRALQIDHTQGGGVKEIRAFKGKNPYYYHLLKNVDSGKYQLLCANCNWIKKYERGEIGKRFL